jgi:uncharacterized protein YjdB
MRNRALSGALLLAGLILPLSSCTSNSGLDSVAISPTSQSLNVGQTAQFTATGTFGNASHESTKDITSSVTWSSTSPTVASVTSTGLVTAVGAGTTTITANAQGFAGPISSSATVTVGSTTGSGGSGGAVVSLAIIPAAQTVATAGQTTQFIAIGTTSNAATEYLTNSVAWSSSNQQIATIGGATGLATAVGAGTTTITAIYTDTSTGSVVTGTATLTVTAGATEQYTSLSILPSSLSLTASGQTSQLVLLGVSGSSGLSENLTSSSSVTWSSSTPTVATVTASGLVTAVNGGSGTIIAQYTNNDGSVVTADVPVSVSISGTGTSLETITSLTIIPSSITVLDFQLTGQFLAIGTFSTVPYVRDVTNLSTTTWLSSEPEVFTVGTNCADLPTGQTCQGNSGSSAGLATAYGSGNATIIAESTSQDGTIQTATATFNCPYQLPDPPTPGSCYPGEAVAPTLLETLTVYNEGLNTTTWEVTAPSATNTPDVIHCGPGWIANGGSGGSVCTATYPEGTTVTLTAPAGAGQFGGWSYNCTPTATITAAGPNSCTVTLTSNDTVGAIFN